MQGPRNRGVLNAYYPSKPTTITPKTYPMEKGRRFGEERDPNYENPPTRRIP